MTLQGEWTQFLNRWRWDYFLTVTRRGEHTWDSARWRRVTHSVIREALKGVTIKDSPGDWYKAGRKADRWLRRRAYGAIIVERPYDRRDHAHAVISGLRSVLTEHDYWVFARRIKYGAGVLGCGWCRIEEVRNSGTIISYLAKYVSKTATGQRSLDCELFGDARHWTDNDGRDQDIDAAAG